MHGLENKVVLGNDVASYTQSVVPSWGEVVKLAENRTPDL